MSQNTNTDQKTTSLPQQETDFEYMLSPVPMEQRRSTYSQIMVWVGFGYVVTGLWVGGALATEGGGMPFGKALLSILLGMGSLLLITFFLGVAAQKTGLNLSLISRFSYGKKGIALPMAVMALLTLGWFASIVGMVGDIWGEFIGNPSGIVLFDPASSPWISDLISSPIKPITLEVFLACMVWGGIFTVSALIGMGAIEKIAKLVAPLILIVAVVVGVIFLNESGGVSSFWSKSQAFSGLSLGEGVTFVVGSWIAGAVMGVDLFRFNKNVRAVFFCAAACFIFTNPLLNIVGYIGAVQVGQYNYVMWLLAVSLIAGLLGVFVWTMSLWTTNNGELYCNALYTGPVLNAFGCDVPRKKLVLICGIIGTVLGALAFYQMLDCKMKCDT